PAGWRRGALEAQATCVRRGRREERDLFAAAWHDVCVDPAGADQGSRRDGPRLLDPGSVPVPPEAPRRDGGGPEDGPPDEGGPPEARGEGCNRGRHRAGGAALRQGGRVPLHGDASGEPAVSLARIPRAEVPWRTY